MLAGFGGHLVSEAFLEEHLAEHLERGPVSDSASGRLRRALNDWHATAATLGPASATRAVLQTGGVPLLDALGFGPPTDVEPMEPLVAATVHAGRNPIALVVAPWGARLDALWRTGVVQASRRAAAWCLLFNGRSLRVIDAGQLHSQRHLEFDLTVCVDDAGTIAALARTASAAALNDVGTTPLRALIQASERHAAGVCRSLRDGVLAASTAVLRTLVWRQRRLGSVADSFEQSLTIVYRMLFLLFAEARALVPLWHPVYKRSYSIESLRDVAERSPHARGLWDALRAIARLAHAGCVADDLRVTPFNGRLFSPARTPLAERRDLDDEAARRAILALSTRPDACGGSRRRIVYRDLGVEQLGAVYETLLDYEPRIEHRAPAHGRSSPPVVTLAAGSGVRKATGTFYTPQPIADYVVRRTLAPLVSGSTAERILSLRIVDPAMGSGAFLVAACRFLAAEYERALIREGACHSTDVGEAERALMRRLVAERCLYGVDINPMAVQLARLSLWLATLASDRPLSFLDHRLQTGDSLVGAWLSSLRGAPPARRRHRSGEMPLFDEGVAAGALREALPVRFSLESTPTDTLEQVHAKERAFAAMTAREAALSRWKRVADVWCAAWFDANIAPAVVAPLADAVLTGRSVLSDVAVERYLSAANRVAAARRFFHWELEFPEAFFGVDGRRLARPGFDAVIGNPPWEMIRADAGSSDARARARADITPLLRFTRDSGLYSAQSAGHANRYQLFVERAVDLTRPGGRIGLVLPSGLATDGGSAALRRMLLTRCAIDAIVGVDNHRGVFPIHRSVRFLLVTASAGSATDRIACRLNVDDPSELARLDAEDDAAGRFPVSLSPSVIERLSGPELTIPTLHDHMDLAIAERAAALFPSLGSPRGWAATFGRELNATDDRDAFRPAASIRHGLPVVEGKHLAPFRVQARGATHAITVADARARLGGDRIGRPRLAYRDVASATNRLTLIAAVLPANCVSVHTVFCLRTPLSAGAQHFLCGLFNSLVVNYLVRLRVTTHVTTATVERLPIPTRDVHPRACRDIAALARLLARRDDPDALARLNARVARLYQLTRSEFEHVLETFPLVPQRDRDAALEVFLRGEFTEKARGHGDE